MIGNTMISISHHQKQAEPQASRADPAAPAFPSQAQGLIGPHRPLAASPQLNHPDAGEQQPLLFVFKKKMAPLATAARGPAELHRSASLEMEIVPQGTQPAPISMQLTPQGNFVQQHSQPPALHNKGKSAPVTCQPPKVRQAPVGTSVSPPCLEIISLKEGFAIKTFPRCSQSCLPADPTRARTEPLPRAAKAQGVPVRSRAPRSVPLVRNWGGMTSGFPQGRPSPTAVVPGWEGDMCPHIPYPGNHIPETPKCQLQGYPI